jgi:hypothetical protein
MGHCISGIITSFKYKGDLPHLYLVGNYVFIPLDRLQNNFKGYSSAPFDNLTPTIKKLIKDLSFTGRCAFIETDFFGGSGTQSAVVYENGKIVLGPLMSLHNVEYSEAQGAVVDEAINQILRFIGILRHSEKDEFDTIRLGYFRSNQDVLDDSQRNMS